ncbi:MurR/RpiR family transcriptional regulator [Nocardioides humi]|uniref:MurR/RpiR family transcriptional regulator n=1 Tax=Nocardioides humi TaxID=449461 RepID=A0ABN2BEE0_9ACTN|nr:MurR/RpiR family transcriptional regulator [Nocardioides humi]
MTASEAVGENLPDDAASAAAEATAVERIRGVLATLRRSDARVATVLLERGERVGVLSVSDVAELAGTSESTVVRACQRMGFRGYHDAKRQLVATAAAPGSPDDFDQVVPADESGDVLEKVVSSSAGVLRGSLSTLDRAAFAATSRALRQARRILLIGVGPSSPIAQDAAYRLRLLGLTVDAPVDSLTQHLSAGLLSAGDVALVISHTGATRETLASAQTAADRGADVVAITSFARSPLTQLATHALVTGGEGTGVRVEAMASRLAHLAIVDALFVDLSVHADPATLAHIERGHDIATEHQL